MNTGYYRQSQSGAVTLIVAAILLVAVLGMSFFMANAVVSEKQMVANEFRSRQALMAGQSGIDYGVAYMREGLDQDDDAALDSLPPGSFVDLSSYIASMSDVSVSGNWRLIRVEARGFSDDTGVQRTVSQVFGMLPWVSNPPGVPVVARGWADLTGNLSVTNNYENITVWTGDNVDLDGSSNTYITIDGNPDQLSTSNNTKGPDVIDGDENLAGLSEDELLQNFLGRSWAELEESATMTELPEPEDAANEFIYIDGDASIAANGDWGDRDADAPVLLAVEGTLTISGTVDFYGLIIAKQIVVTGTLDVFGGVIATQNVDFGAGNVELTYDDAALSSLGGRGDISAIYSSWKDWSD